MGLVITLILVGIILILVEILLIPGIGIAGILGLTSICGSAYYAFAHLGPWTGVIVTVVNITLLAVLIFYALRGKTWKRLELDTVIDKHIKEEEVAVGDRGMAATRLGPIGTARINDKSYEVTSLEGMIDAGTRVEIVHIENNKIYVRPVMKDEAF